jgi:hypothetical protein
MRHPTSVLAALLLAVLGVGAGCRESQVYGPGGSSVTSVTTRAMNIRRGEQKALAVDIDRRDFSGPVTVSIWQLPRGVTVDQSSVKTDADQASFVLKAAPDAGLVENQAVGITIESPDGRRASHYVNVTVTE